MIAMLITAVMFMLVNISYWCVVPVGDYILEGSASPSVDLASEFFGRLFGPTGQRAMEALIALSIFGGMLVMTFTAGRVKQEIAKEGVLPFSRFFAAAHVTVLQWLQIRNRTSKEIQSPTNKSLERAPVTGLMLHWLASVVCLLATCMLRPELVYKILVTLYGYSTRILVELAVAGGLLYLKFKKQSDWSKIATFKTRVDPWHCIILFVVSAVLLFGGLGRSAVPVTTIPGLAWYVVPLIALSSPFWGVLWWLCLRGIEKFRRQDLVVTRTPFIEERDGQFVQVAEIVEHMWRAVVPSWDLEG